MEATGSSAPAEGEAFDPQVLVISMSLSWAGLTDPGEHSSCVEPVLVYSVCDGEDRSEYREVARTVAGDKHPVFRTTYRFGETTLLRFEVFSEKPLSRTPEPLGRIFCTSLDMVVYLNVPYKRALLTETGKKGAGFLVIVPTAQKSPKGFAALQLSARNVPLKTFFRTADSMLELWRQDTCGTSALVHETDVVRNSGTPHWKKIVVNKNRIGKDSDAILIKCFDVSFSGEKTYLGYAETNIRELAQGTEKRLEWQCKQDSSTLFSKTPVMLRLEYYKDYPWSFIDYMHGDFSVNFAYIIDLSSSNRDITSIDIKQRYEATISAFEDVISQYDEEQLIPALGFGAKVPPSNMTQSLIFLNGADNPRCKGMQGVMEALRQSLERVTPTEPSELAPSLEYMTGLADNFRDSSKYYVVLVLTDGKLDYTFKTVDSLIRASSTAMSVVMIGLSDEVPRVFEELQRDKLRKKNAERDIFFSVLLKDYLHRLHELPRDALSEVPNQIMQFLAFRDVEPAPVTAPTMNAPDLCPSSY
ncbi:putative copine [Ixodes scapularis]